MGERQHQQGPKVGLDCIWGAAGVWVRVGHTLVKGRTWAAALVSWEKALRSFELRSTASPHVFMGQPR